jgi:hypothetical protein
MSGLAAHRKLFVLIAGMFLTMLLNKAGVDARELLGPGAATNINALIEGAVDLLIIGGIPAVLMWAQPNAEDDSIFRYWRAILLGGVGVVAAIGVVVVLL